MSQLFFGCISCRDDASAFEWDRSAVKLKPWEQNKLKEASELAAAPPRWQILANIGPSPPSACSGPCAAVHGCGMPAEVGVWHHGGQYACHSHSPLLLVADAYSRHLDQRHDGAMEVNVVIVAVGRIGARVFGDRIAIV